MKRTMWVIAGLAGVLLGVAGGVQAKSMSCDRSCLREQLDNYLVAMVAHDPSKLSLAKKARFTEDGVEMKLGEGVWKTVTKLRSYRQDFLDTQAGAAAAFVVLDEGESPALYVVRLKVVDKKIAEIETQITRGQREGFIFEVDALQAPSEAMIFVPLHKDLNSREDAIKIAAKYPEGLKAGSFVAVDAPFAADAYRFENGRRMAGKGCVFRPPSCEDIKAQKIPKLSQLTYRVAVVDEQMGIVLLHLNFGPGSVGPKDKSLIVWEAFKVYGGQMHAVEAFMKVMPSDAPSGWD